jgi:hypothetical protein
MGTGLFAGSRSPLREPDSTGRWVLTWGLLGRLRGVGIQATRGFARALRSFRLFGGFRLLGIGPKARYDPHSLQALLPALVRDRNPVEPVQKQTAAVRQVP